MERYADYIGFRNTGVAGNTDMILQSKFEPVKCKTTIVIEPLTVADRHGRMLLWYLPNIFTMKRRVCGKFMPALQTRTDGQASILEDLLILEGLFNVEQSQPQNWRAGPNYFTPVPRGLPVGVINLSPAWFEQAHEVDIGTTPMRQILTSTLG